MLRAFLAAALLFAAGWLGLPWTAPLALSILGRQIGLELSSSPAEIRWSEGTVVLRDVQGRLRGDRDSSALTIPEVHLEIRPSELLTDGRVARVRAVRPRLELSKRGLRELERLARTSTRGGPAGAPRRPAPLDRLEVESATLTLPPLTPGAPPLHLQIELTARGLSSAVPAIDLQASLPGAITRLKASLPPLPDGRFSIAIEGEGLRGAGLRPYFPPDAQPSIRDGAFHLEGVAAVAGETATLDIARGDLTDGGRPEAHLDGASLRLDWSRGWDAARFEMTRPFLRVVRDARGRVTVGGFTVFDPDARRVAHTAEPLPDLWLRRLRIDGAVLSYEDPEVLGDTPLLLSDVDVLGLDLQATDAPAPPTPEGERIFMRGRIEGLAAGFGLQATLRARGGPDAEVSLGLFALHLPSVDRLARRFAQVQLQGGDVSFHLKAVLQNGVVDAAARVLGKAIRVRGRGAYRPIPGSGGRTLVSVLEELSDDDGALDVRLPFRFELARALREGLTADVLGLDTAGLVGEAVRQAVGGAVGSILGLFRQPRPLRAVTISLPAGEVGLDTRAERIVSGVATALRSHPRAAVLIRALAGPERRPLAEARALAVRDALIAAGAEPVRVLLGRPLTAEEVKTRRLRAGAVAILPVR